MSVLPGLVPAMLSRGFFWLQSAAIQDRSVQALIMRLSFQITCIQYKSTKLG